MLALDQGTTSSRCILFDKQGNICSMAQKEFEQIYLQAGWVEHDPMEIRVSQLSVATETISKIGAAAEEIAGIGRNGRSAGGIVWSMLFFRRPVLLYTGRRQKYIRHRLLFAYEYRKAGSCVHLRGRRKRRGEMPAGLQGEFCF